MDPRENVKGGFRRYQSDLGKEKFPQKRLIRAKRKKTKKKNQKVPKGYFGSKREKEKEKKTKKKA